MTFNLIGVRGDVVPSLGAPKAARDLAPARVFLLDAVGTLGWLGSTGVEH